MIPRVTFLERSQDLLCYLGQTISLSQYHIQKHSYEKRSNVLLTRSVTPQSVDSNFYRRSVNPSTKTQKLFFDLQARTHQLLVQNKELLEHIAALVSHLREHERGGMPGLAAPLQPSGGPVPTTGSSLADSLGQVTLYRIP